MPFLTIFTPTYNRAYILKKLYNSLLTQSCTDFEWIIVDDESSDNTEELIRTFDTQKVTILYHRQKHGGKHRAINWGVAHASGELFFIVDSDDYLTCDAVESLQQWYSGIRKNENICGVAGLRISKEGKIWGGNPDVSGHQYIDATNLERARFHLEGDKAEAYKTDVLKRYPFPEFPGEYFVTEAVVWNAIAADGYKIRWYNRPIYVCNYLDDGLTRTGANDHKGHLHNIQGFALYVSQQIRWTEKSRYLGDFVDYNRCCHERKISIRERSRMLGLTTARFIQLVIWSFFARVRLLIRNILKIK